jgi:hypothetical protein
VQDFSTWTWRRGDGSEYPAGQVSALWRRVADRTLEDAQLQFGELTAPRGREFFAGVTRSGEGFAAPDDASRWSGLHYLLGQVADLWVPMTEASEIHTLDTFRMSRDPAAEVLRIAVGQAAVGGEITPRLDGWRLEFRPRSLRAGLLMGVVADIAGRRRLRRCDACHEWFSFARSDARFCSSLCRAHAHKQES